MERLNIRIGKININIADLVDKITSVASSIKYKDEKEKEVIIYNGPAISETDKLSPFDSNCNQQLIAKVTQLSSDYGFDNDGEQYIIEQHEVTYIDGSDKVFEVCTGVSGVSITEVKIQKVQL